jgi:hypothetical protein
MKSLDEVQDDNARRDAEETKRRNLFIVKMRDLMDTDAGKVLVWEILSFCELYNASPRGELTPYFEGRRSVGVYLLELLNEVNPRIYPRLIIEKLEERI